MGERSGDVLAEVGHGGWLRFLLESFKKGAALGGEAVFLQAAVGFFRDGAFDEVVCKQPQNLFFQFSRNCLVADGASDFHFRQRPVGQATGN